MLQEAEPGPGLGPGRLTSQAPRGLEEWAKERGQEAQGRPRLGVTSPTGSTPGANSLPHPARAAGHPQAVKQDAQHLPASPQAWPS